MGIRFLGTPIEEIDQLCREEEIVMVTIETFKTEVFADGTIQETQTGGYGSSIKSSKDIFQFNYEDMKMLTRDTKRSLR